MEWFCLERSLSFEPLCKQEERHTGAFRRKVPGEAPRTWAGSAHRHGTTRHPRQGARGCAHRACTTPAHSQDGAYIPTKQEILCCCLVSHVAHPRWNVTVIKNTHFLRPSLLHEMFNTSLCSTAASWSSGCESCWHEDAETREHRIISPFVTPNGFVTSSSTQEHTKAIPILCQCWHWFYRTCKHPALLFSAWLNTMCCNKRKSKNRERKWELHSFGLPSHTRPFTLPALLPDSWNLQALNYGIPKRHYRALCQSMASMSKDDLPNTLWCFTSSSNISPLLYRAVTWTYTHTCFPGCFSVLSPCCEQSDTPSFLPSFQFC